MKTSTSRRDFLLAAGAAVAAAPWASQLVAAAAAPSYQIGCYTRPFDQHEYRVALDAIAEAGYKYCGIMTAKGKSWVIVTDALADDEAAKIAAEVKQRGLKALSVYGAGFPVAKSVEAGVAGLRRLIDHCATIEAGNLLLGGTSDEKLYADYYKVVAECCDYAAAKGVGLSVKPHGGRNATAADCRKAINLVGHKNFRVWYDPGNIFFYSDGKIDPVDDVAGADGLVAGVSVKDFKPPKNVMVTPGTGQVDFAKVLAKLKAGGFTAGPLIVECLDKGDLQPTIAEARKARLFLEELTAKLSG
jgi:sugar phosphate isomerase/epimerase